MALIGTIRKNSWLLVIAIGLALGAFVIMDVTSQGGPSSGSLTLVKVDGEKVDWIEFQNAEKILYSGSNVDVFSQRNYLYNYFVDRAIIQDEAGANGISVPTQELIELQFGTNLSPLVRERFADPNTGMVDRTQLNSIRQSINSGQLPVDLQRFWAYQEKEIIKERLQQKLINIVRQGFYTPSWLVEKTNIDQSLRTDFMFVRIPYDDVPDNEVKVTDRDLRKYLNEHISQYERPKETRVVEFVAFPVRPTSTDTVQLRNEIENQIREFRTTENDTLFVENNYGSIDFAYVKPNQVSPLIVDSIFSMPINTVIGPYIEDNAFKAVKIRDRKIIPDSVHVRHILRQAQNIEQLISGQKIIDSLKTLIESGEQPFDSLAMQFSQGASSVTAAGGDLGWNGLGTFAKSFEDLAFYHAEIGELYSLITQFGVHLVEVLDRKFITNETGVQLAFLHVPIVPSEETQNELYEEAIEIASENRTLEDLRNAMIERIDVTVQSSIPFEENQFTISVLGSGQTSRDIIRYAFGPSTNVNSVSADVFIYQNPDLFYNNRYVIAGLSEITPAGVPSLDELRPDLEGIVRNRFKGEFLAGQLTSVTDLNEVAQKYNTTIDTARGVNFMSDFIANLGEEPRVAAVANKIEIDQISKPIIGASGVFIIRPFSRTGPNELNVTTLRQSTMSQMRQQATAGVMQSLRFEAKIDDNRYQFY